MKQQKPVPPPAETPLQTDEMPEQTGQDVQVDYQPTLPAVKPQRKIHERQPLPSVPAGEAVPDESATPSVKLD